MRDTTQLAEAQERLVSALVSGEEPPAGFDARGARATSAILLAKRRKAVTGTVPMISRSLGTDFRAQFDLFARTSPCRTKGDSLADAIAFLGWLRRANALPSDLRFLSLRLRWQRVTRR